MDESIQNVFAQLRPNPAAKEELIEELHRFVTVGLPSDYIQFLLSANGANGIGPNLFVHIWPAGEIANLNKEYHSGAPVSGLLLIGDDGCGNLLGIDTRSNNPQKMNYCWF